VVGGCHGELSAYNLEVFFRRRGRSQVRGQKNGKTYGASGQKTSPEANQPPGKGRLSSGIPRLKDRGQKIRGKKEKNLAWNDRPEGSKVRNRPTCATVVDRKEALQALFPGNHVRVQKCHGEQGVSEHTWNWVVRGEQSFNLRPLHLSK